MQNKNVLSFITYWFNHLMICITKPKTKVTSLYLGNKPDTFNIKDVAKWIALRRIDKGIETFINTYNKQIFKGENLYNIKYSDDLYDAMLLLKHGVAQESDFLSSNKLISAIKNYEIESWNRELFNSFYNDLDLENKARNESNTQEEYSHLLFVFAKYKYNLIKHSRTTKLIAETIEEFGISEYLGKSLYEIREEKILDEGIDAIELMHDLLQKGIDTFQNIKVPSLSLFLLKKLRDQYNENDFSNIHFDDAARRKFILAENTKEIAAAQREKRNAQARARRAKLKAQKEPAAKKALKQKPISKVSKKIKAKA